MFIVRQYRPCACIAPLFIVLSMHSYICIVAPHLGTLDVRRVDVKRAVWSRTTRRRSGVSPEGGRTAEATEDLAQWSEGPKALQKLTLT